jgi:hypothetical protein
VSPPDSVSGSRLILREDDFTAVPGDTAGPENETARRQLVATGAAAGPKQGETVIVAVHGTGGDADWRVQWVASP